MKYFLFVSILIFPQTIMKVNVYRIGENKCVQYDKDTYYCYLLKIVDMQFDIQ